MGFGSLRGYDWEYQLNSLEDSGDKEMNVDGSSVNKIYKWTPGTGEVWFLERISFFMLDVGEMNHDTFGALPASLTNGLRLVIKKGGNDFKIKDVLDNVDVFMSFPFEKQTGNSPTGFLNEADYFSGTLIFEEPIMLKETDGDLVKILVRDDLTAVDRLRSSILIRRAL